MGASGCFGFTFFPLLKGYWLLSFLATLGESSPTLSFENESIGSTSSI